MENDSKYEYPLPKQKLSFNEKDEKWQKANVDALIKMSTFSSSNYKYEIQKLYELYNGNMNESDYNYIVEPYGAPVNNFPSKIRNFPIITPVIDTLIGEYIKRPKNFTVVCRNSDSLSMYEKELNESINNAVEQMFINKLVEKGLSDEEIQNTPHPADIARWFQTSYKDKRAILGQNALNIIKDECQIERKQTAGFKDFLIAGEVYTYRGVVGNELTYEIVNPLDIDYAKDPDLVFIEDADWVVRRKLAHASTIIDAYYDKLNTVQIDRLENPTHGNVSVFGQYQIPLDNRSNNALTPNRLIEIFHVCWKSLRKIGILTYIDDMGVPQKDEVSEDYKPNKEAGESVEWLWINEVWEGTRIDGDIYIDVKPVDVQRNHLDNISKCKLPYNGIRFSDRNAFNVSLCAKGLPYQITYNAYKYRLELSVAKAKDVIGQIDINTVPKDWEMDKFLYYMDAMGIAFVDYNQEGVKNNPQHQTVIDLTNKSIQSYLLLLDAIEQEWERVSGVSRQRKGQMTQNDLVGTTQQSIIQSAVITEIYYYLYSQLEQSDLQAMLDYSKAAWINGKKGVYYQPDIQQNIYLDINGPDIAESEFGVFLSNSSKDLEKLQSLRGIAAQMTNGTVPLSSIAEVIDSDNFATIKQKIKEAESAAQQAKQAQEEFLAKKEQENIQSQLEHDKFLMDNENYNKEEDRQTKIYVAEIQAFSRQRDLDSDGDGTPDPVEIAKLALEERKQSHLEHQSKNQDYIDKKTLELKEKDMNLKKELKEKDIEAKKQISRTKKKST